MTALVWVGIVLGSLMALLLLAVTLLLLVPVAVDAAWGDEQRGFAVAGPGLRVSFDARAHTTELRLLAWRVGHWTSPAERRKKPQRRRRRARPRPAPRKLWAERWRVIAALRAFFRRLHVRRLWLEATLATPDPALTGWLTGAAYAVRAVTPRSVQRAVSLQPDFASESPRLALDASVRVQPLHAAVLAVRMWRVVRRARAGGVRRDDRPWRSAFASLRRERARRAEGSGAADGSAKDRPRGGGRKRP